MSDENRVIELAKQGNRDAFAQLVRDYSRPLLRFVANVVGDQHHAEDVVQKSFFNAYRNLHRFDPRRAQFSTWIFRIARNAALNHRRDHSGHEISFCTEPSTDGRELSPDAIAELREQYALLDDALAKLPDHQRFAWVLFDLEGLTQKQVAEIEGVAEGTIKSRVSRARMALRKILADQIGMER